jgi:hypothetical protein
LRDRKSGMWIHVRGKFPLCSKFCASFRTASRPWEDTPWFARSSGIKVWSTGCGPAGKSRGRALVNVVELRAKSSFVRKRARAVLLD